jgi:hypothetical protein
MTPALKAMVEAMKAEIAAQVAEQVADYQARKWGASFAHFAPDSDTSPECQINGAIDLEKVARAGLEALKPADDAILNAMRQSVPVYGYEWEYVEGDAQEHWTDMIDAITATTAV